MRNVDQFPLTLFYEWDKRLWRIREVISKIAILYMTFRDEKWWKNFKISQFIRIFIFLSCIDICCFWRTEEIIPAYVSSNMGVVHVSNDEKVKCISSVLKPGILRIRQKIWKTPANSRVKFRLALNSMFSLYARIQFPEIFFSLIYSASRFYPACARSWYSSIQFPRHHYRRNTFAQRARFVLS